MIGATAAVAAYAASSGLEEPARRMVAIFTGAAIFWAFEVLPLHATSLLVIALQTILLKNHWRLFLSSFSNPVIFLFFGGFCLAVAVRKYKLDHVLVRRLVKAFGTHPFWILAGFMSTSAFFALWMSNTATTAMMLAVIAPLLTQMDHNDPYRKALVLGIPFAARAGSLGTPVGTPPNALAVGFLAEQGHSISFLSWMRMGVPLGILILITSCVILYLSHRPQQKRFFLHVAEREPVPQKAKWVVLISLATMMLWMTSGIHGVPEAVVALTAGALLFGSRLLDQDDLKKIDWDILILMWGGLALGEGIEASGLAMTFFSLPWLNHQGIALVAVLCVTAMLISTFMSNTTAASLLIPVAAGLAPMDNTVLIIAVALSCSFDIPLPVSSPPNALAFSTRVITVKDMLKAGIPVALLAVALIILGSKFLFNRL